MPILVVSKHHWCGDSVELSGDNSNFPKSAVTELTVSQCYHVNAITHCLTYFGFNIHAIGRTHLVTHAHDRAKL